MNKEWIDGVICDISGVTDPLKKAGFTVVENVLFHGRFVGMNGKPISGELRDTYCQLLQLNYGRRKEYVEIPLRHLEFHMRKPVKTLERHLPELVACGLLDKEIRKNGNLNLPTRYIFRPFPVREVFRASARIRYFHTLSASNPPLTSDHFDSLFDDIWIAVGPNLENHFHPARLTMKQASAEERQKSILEQIEQMVNLAPVTKGQAISLKPAVGNQISAVIDANTSTVECQVAERIGQTVTVTLTGMVTKWAKQFEEAVILAAVDHAVGGAGSKPVTLNWIAAILSDWHRHGVRTVADAERVINDHREQRRKRREDRGRSKGDEPTRVAVKARCTRRKGRFDHFIDRGTSEEPRRPLPASIETDDEEWAF